MAYEDQIDLLLLEVPELVRYLDDCRDVSDRLIEYRLVAVFGSMVDHVLGSTRDGWMNETVPPELVGDMGFIDRAMGVIEEWADDGTPGVRGLLGTGFFEAFYDDDGWRRLAPYLGPSAFRELKLMAPYLFEGNAQPEPPAR